MKRIGFTLFLAAALALAGGGVSHASVSTSTLTPLPAPGQPVVSELTPTTARLTWPRSAGPVFRTSVLRLVDGTWQGVGGAPANTSVVGLTPGGTSTFAVQTHAMPFSGYTSSELSPPVTVTAPLS